MIQRKRRDFKKGVRGLAPPIVLSGQPSALLALLIAGIARTPIATPLRMAQHWEISASTTHSLTPSPSNRPLIFWILTPRKNPGAAGSAGRCEPGVGRFTDPHPLTCSFFTPLSTARFFGVMLRSEERFCAGLRASSFLLCLALSVSFTPPPTGEGLGIVFLGFVGFTLLVHRRSRWPSRASLGLCRCRSLLGSQNRIQGLHGLFLFPSFFPYGERLV